MVQGPVPVTEVELTLPVPWFVVLMWPVGFVQVDGTTTVTADPAVKVVVVVRKLKVKLLPLLLFNALPGETSIVPVPSPLASVKMADAVSWEVSPVAVARNVAPLNSWEKMYQLVSNSPFSSATTAHGSNDCWTGSVST